MEGSARLARKEAPLTVAPAFTTPFPASYPLAGYLFKVASTSRADRMRYSSPSTLTSVPPYFE